MARYVWEVSDAIKAFLPALSAKLPADHLRTLHAISKCRTAALGGHVDACDQCGHTRISYNSCRNRHCPKCQGVEKEAWIVMQEDIMLPVVYYHIVFTLPHQFNTLCIYNASQMYEALFKASWYTLNTLAHDPKWLGAQTAATMVLHTWGQNLSLHPHIHCIVPNGGLTSLGQWKFPKRGNHNFLFPVKALKDVFKARFLKLLREKYRNGNILLPPDISHLGEFLDKLYNLDWVIYTKKPFSGAKHVIDYLARYSHRVAITNQRIKAIDEQHVYFEYKDYRLQGKKKTMALTGQEFIRRLTLHFLPKGFRKIRMYGLVSNASKAKSINTARVSLGFKHKELLNKHQRKQIAIARLFGNTHACPYCKKGTMTTIDIVFPNKDPPSTIKQ